MNKTQLLAKMAERRPRLEDRVNHWGLPKEHVFPLDTPELVKASSVSFDGQMPNMTMPQRLVASRNICARAQELDVNIDSSLAHKYASSYLSRHFPTFLAMRKQATAHTTDDELDKLLEVANIFNNKSDINDRVKGLDKIASALEGFDCKNNLTGHWGHWFPDPAYSTFGLTADPDACLETVVKVADYAVSGSDLDGADWSRVEGKLLPEVVDGLKTAEDKLTIFASLPAPEKEVIYQTLFAE